MMIMVIVKVMMMVMMIFVRMMIVMMMIGIGWYTSVGEVCPSAELDRITAPTLLLDRLIDR